MQTIRRAQLLVFLLSLLVGMCALWSWQPRQWFHWLDETLAPHQNDRFQIGAKLEDGHSKTERDRIMREVIPPSQNALEYVICLIDDDPDDINPYGIYHPLDISTTLLNLHKQSVKRVMIGTHLQWADHDEVELEAFALALKPFDKVTIALPLKRSVEAGIMPKPLERSAIPLDDLHGDASLIPQVNQVSLPTLIPFPKNTYAGFSELESEPAAAGMLPLLARWGDQILPSAYLVEMAAEHGCSPSDLIIYPGKYIRIGNTGNVIPIDEYGNFLLPEDYDVPAPPRTITSAYSSESSIIGATQSAAILTANGEKSSLFNALSSPYLHLTLLHQTPRVGEAHVMPRLPIWLELILISDLAFLCAWLLPYRSIRRNTTFICCAFGLGVCALILYHGLNYWSPASLYLSTLMGGWLITTLLANPVRRRYQANLKRTTD